ncbi:MAG: hypothetical protein WAM28_05870 [Chlamydiales bacterium]
MATPTQEKVFPNEEKLKLPRPFILRRLHSLLGIWLAIYLFEHLLVNSQAAFFYKDDGQSFVSMVNKIHDLAFLRVIEVVFLGLPFLIHGLWGISYLWTGKLNAHRTNGTSPSLPQYRRNRAYSWQRISSWILLVGIIAHVIHMRFLENPAHAQFGDREYYMVRLDYDTALPLTAEKLHTSLYSTAQIQERQAELETEQSELNKLKDQSPEYEEDDPYHELFGEVTEEQDWLKAAQKTPLKKGQVLAVAPSAGAAFLLVVRETFKSPLMVILYSILVVAAAYHGFNGLWTFLITWGITLTRRSQKRIYWVTTTLMGVVMFLGLLSAWGTYWTTLFQR